MLGPWLEERRRLGLDGRDEVWEGILHMVPAAAFEHDAFVFALVATFHEAATTTLRLRDDRPGEAVEER